MATTSESSTWRIRAYAPHDRAAILELARRLAIGIAPWRSVDGTVDAALRWTEESLAGIGPERMVFVAETPDGALLGYASVARKTEFTGEEQAYIGELAVAASAEGAGIGSALLTAIESWARHGGLTLIVLDTGAANARARGFYARHGFVEESVRLTRVLDPSSS